MPGAFGESLIYTEANDDAYPGGWPCSADY
jgi:hypothetical protein